MTAETQRIAEIALEGEERLRSSPELEQERAAAISALLADNRFAPSSGRKGPFHLRLAIEDHRLKIDIRSATDGSGETIFLPLAPFRRIVRDYLLLCESHHEALKRPGLRGVEAIDVGRRAVHNEGSERLMAELAGKAEIDHETGRRLFTLISVLQLRG
jgi:uncharacterized protein (UPF0262 family)